MKENDTNGTLDGGRARDTKHTQDTDANSTPPAKDRLQMITRKKQTSPRGMWGGTTKPQDGGPGTRTTRD